MKVCAKCYVQTFSNANLNGVAVAGTNAGGEDCGGTVKVQEEEEEEEEEEEMPQDPRLMPYRKMLMFGVPLPAVCQKMIADGLDVDDARLFLTTLASSDSDAAPFLQTSLALLHDSGAGGNQAAAPNANECLSSESGTTRRRRRSRGRQKTRRLHWNALRRQREARSSLAFLRLQRRMLSAA
jgi:hypothetical protein